MANTSLRDFWRFQGPALFDENYLAALRQYDPDARYFSNNGQFESNMPGTGIWYADPTKMPSTKYGTYGSFVYGDPSRTDLIDPSLRYEDAVYGWITPATNVQNAKPELWERLAPIAVAGLGAAGGLGLLGGAPEAAGAGWVSGYDLPMGSMGGTAGTGAGGAGGAGWVSGYDLPAAAADVVGSDWASGLPSSMFSNTGDVIGSDWAAGLPSAMNSNTGGGMLSTVGNALGKLAGSPVGSALASKALSGLLGDGGGGGLGGLLGGGGRGFGGTPGVVPGSEDDATKMARLLRQKQGLGQYLLGGSANG